MWYGQKETDKYIAEYFPEGYMGNCVEVGVADGKKGSNTLHFEELGWDVLCIDPIPFHVEAAKKIRKNVVEYACSQPCLTGTREFYVFDIGENNILSSLSGLEPDPKLLVSHGHLINKCSTIKVEARTLDWILTNNKWPSEIDFISIDTEGTELNVLKGIIFAMTDIKLLVVENNHNDTEIEEYLKWQGWRKDQRYFVNDFYVRNNI